MKKYSAGLICFLFFFFGSSFLNAYTTFFINSESTDFNLESLKNIKFNATVSFNENIPAEGEPQPYKIERDIICEERDEENFTCLKTAPNLCPYISLEAQSEENTEIGFPLSYYISENIAQGELNYPTDTSDTWAITINAPCFQGECPNNYDTQKYGEPLAQEFKNKTFKCELAVNWNGAIFQTLQTAKTAFAATTNKIIISATFTEVTEKHIDPVIIIPGIMGSSRKNGELLIDPILHTYDDLIATLEANGYQKNIDLFTFPYEWRDSNILSANLLKEKIDQVKQICKCDEVDLVAHSMGGLVAREYIQQSGEYDNDIDQLIFLGTPHKGSPKSYLQWEAGENDTDIRSKIINKYFEAEAIKNGYQTVFDYIQNRPIDSVQELLPIFDYIKDDETEIMRPYSDSHYSDTYPENNFLFILDKTLPFLLNSGIDITNIIGDSKEDKTIEKIRVKPTNHPKYWEHGKPDGFDGTFGDNGLERGVGDNTVTKNSATLENVTNEEVLASHNRIPTVAENKIFKILTGKDSKTNIDNGPNLSVTVLLFQLLSPIDILITAPDGKRMGKNFATGEEYNEIPGAFYSGFKTDEEYVTIPNPLDGEYKIELQGTGDGGEFGVVTTYISDESSVSKEYTDTIKPGEFKETSVITDDANNVLSLEIKTREVTSTPIVKSDGGSSSGSRHREEGEVLGASTISEDQRVLQLKLIEYLKQLIGLYMLLLNK